MCARMLKVELIEVSSAARWLDHPVATNIGRRWWAVYDPGAPPPPPPRTPLSARYPNPQKVSRCPLLSPPSSPAPHVSIERGPEFAGTMLSGLKRGPESGSDILCRWLEWSLLRGCWTITIDGQDFLLVAYFATSIVMMMMIMVSTCSL